MKRTLSGLVVGVILVGVSYYAGHNTSNITPTNITPTNPPEVPESTAWAYCYGNAQALYTQQIEPELATNLMLIISNAYTILDPQFYDSAKFAETNTNTTLAQRQELLHSCARASGITEQLNTNN